MAGDFLAQEAAETEHTSTQNLGSCWAVQCRSARGKEQALESEGWQEEVKRESPGRQPPSPLLFPLIRPIPQSRRPPHNPSRVTQGAQPSRAMHGTTTSPSKRCEARQATDDAIRHRVDPTIESSTAGTRQCQLPSPKSLPRLSRHPALSLICDLLIWPSRCLALFLGHAFARRRSLGFSLVFLASNSQSSHCAPCAPLLL